MVQAVLPPSEPASAVIKLPEYRGHGTGCVCCCSAGGEAHFQAAPGSIRDAAPFIFLREIQVGGKKTRVCCTESNWTDRCVVLKKISSVVKC